MRRSDSTRGRPKSTRAPDGMAPGSTGALASARAVRGTYALKVTITDSRGPVGAAATIPVNVAA